MGKLIVMNVCAKHAPFDGRVYDKIGKTLVNCGYEVHNTSPNVKSTLTEDGIYLHGFHQGAGLLKRVVSYSGLYEHIKTIHPDCMICHEPDALFVAYQYYKKARKHRSIKLYFDCHEAYEYWFSNATTFKFVNKLFGKIIMSAINYVVKNIDGVTSVNNIMTERFKRYNKNSYFLPSVYKKDKDYHFVDNNSTDVVYMGQFGHSKQKEMLIEAAKILKNKGILVKITIIGGTKDKNESDPFERTVEKENVEEYFDIKGWLPREESFNLLSKYGVGMMRFDSYTTPGNYAMPNKLFEYMSLGLAILSCRLNLEIKRIINDNKCGILINNETGEDLADALIYIKMHPEAIYQMKQNAYRATAEKYNWESYKTLLERLVEG